MKYIKDENVVDEVKKNFIGNNGKDEFVISFSFFVKENGDHFKLGEISGMLTEMATVLQSKYLTFRIKGHLSKEKNTQGNGDEDDVEIYSVNVVFKRKQVGKIEELLNFYNPHKINFELNFDQAPAPENVDSWNDFMNLIINYKIEIPQEMLRFFETFLEHNLHFSKQEAQTYMILIRSLNCINTRFDLDSEHMKKVFELLKVPSELSVINWSTFSLLVKGLISTAVFKNEGDENMRIPETLETVYQTIKEQLHGLHSIRLLLGKHLFECKANNLLFFNLLPSKEDVFQFTQKHKKGTF